MSIRWKAVWITVALLGVAHFVATPILSYSFNAGLAPFIQPPMRLETLSLDLLNGQLNAKNLRMEAWTPQDAPLLEMRQATLQWERLPLLSKRLVLEEISAAGVNIVIPWDVDEPPWRRIALQLPALGSRLSAMRQRHRASGFVIKNIYLADISARVQGNNKSLPPLPALSHLTLRVRNARTCFEPCKQPLEFLLEGRLEGQERSYLRAEGALLRNDNGWEGECELRFEGLEIAKLWPWINPAWMPDDFEQFQATEGVMNLSSRLVMRHGRWSVRNDLALKQLKVRLNPGSPYRHLRGASPELVMNAINTLGDSSMQFSSYREWKSAFEENVMKGIRNLIRKSISDSLMGLFHT